MIATGAHVGPYTLSESLSVGRRTALYRAAVRDASDGLPARALVRVALTADDLEAAAAVAAEHEALARLEDPRIPTVLSHLPADAALLMRDPGGVTLREVQRAVAAGAARLDLGTVLDIVVELAGALRHAHARQIVHGAVSPERVVLGDDGEVVLLGFGAPARPPAEAPEQASGTVDARTDQWLLGAFALALLRHDPVSSGDDPPASAGALLSRIALRAPAAAEVLTRMLAADPAERFDEEGLVRALMRAARAFGGVSRRGEVAAATQAWASRPPDPVADPAAAPTDTDAPADTNGVAGAPEPSPNGSAEPAPRPAPSSSPEPPLARRVRLEGPRARTVGEPDPSSLPLPERMAVSMGARSGPNDASGASGAGAARRPDTFEPELGGVRYQGTAQALVDASPDLPDMPQEPSLAPRLLRDGVPMGPTLSAEVEEEEAEEGRPDEPAPPATSDAADGPVPGGPLTEGPFVDAPAAPPVRAERAPPLPDWVPIVALLLLAASALYAVARALG